jgi:hypothetical protein
METGGIQFERGVYELTSSNDNKTTFDYHLIDTNPINGDSLLTEIIRIELDNGYHDRSRSFSHWLFFRADTWKKSPKTGLAKTPIERLYEGNIPRELTLDTKNKKGKNYQTEQHLIIAHGFNDGFIVDVFKNSYIRRNNVLNIFIKEHYEKHFYK